MTPGIRIWWKSSKFLNKPDFPLLTNDRQQPMKKLILQFLLIILLFTGLAIYPFSDRAISAPTCTIDTRSAQLSKGTLTYSQAGNGAPVLLLHGLFADKEQWNSIMCQLASAGYRAIAPDLPGYGASQGFDVVNYALDNQVKLLHEFAKKLGINRLDIAGSSMGGAIATLYTQQYPQQVRSLAFIGSPLGVIEWAKPVREAIYQGINPFIPITTDQFDLEIRLLFVTPPQIPDSIKAAKVKDYVDRNRHYQQVWDIVNLYDQVLCRPPAIQIPTLIIWGQADKIYDIQGADRLQRCIPRSQLLKLPEAGHLLLMESADAAAPAYLNFLKANKAVPSPV